MRRELWKYNAKENIKELCSEANRLGVTLEEYLLYRILVKIDEGFYVETSTLATIKANQDKLENKIDEGMEELRRNLDEIKLNQMIY